MSTDSLRRTRTSIRGSGAVTRCALVGALALASVAGAQPVETNSDGSSEYVVPDAVPPEAFVDDGAIEDPLPATADARIPTERQQVTSPVRTEQQRTEEVKKEPPWRRAVFSWNPASLLFGILSGEVEYATAQMNTVFVSPSLAMASLDIGGGDTLSIYGVGATVGGRLFLTGRAPEGLWGSVEGGAALIVMDINDLRAGRAVALAGTAMGGYSFLFNALYLSLGIGAKYQILSADLGSYYYDATALYPGIRLAIGAAP